MTTIASALRGPHFCKRRLSIRYTYDIRDQDGHVLKEREGFYNHPGSFERCELEPHKSISHEYLLSWLFDFSKPGTCSVQVSRGISGNDTDGVVRSNLAKIVVTP
jgi:hypothetical protein